MVGCVLSGTLVWGRAQDIKRPQDVGPSLGDPMLGARTTSPQPQDLVKKLDSCVQTANQKVASMKMKAEAARERGFYFRSRRTSRPMFVGCFSTLFFGATQRKYPTKFGLAPGRKPKGKQLVRKDLRPCVFVAGGATLCFHAFLWGPYIAPIFTCIWFYIHISHHPLPHTIVIYAMQFRAAR